MAKKYFQDMTDDEKAKHTKLFLKPCRSRKELQVWIKHFLDLYLPDVRVSRYADTTPLDVVWEVYRICVLRQNPENIQELLYVAGRGSGKTLGMAIAELMVLLHDKRDVVHVGAILTQAERCYAYQKNFLYSRNIKDMVMPAGVPEDQRILEKANMSNSVFNINKEKVTLEVLPCTLKACNGPHVPLVVVDEIDTVSGEGVKAFKEISGMLDSKGGRKALRVGISTRKSRYGLMNRQIENADAEGRTVRRWTAFEFTERCPDSRSGTQEVDMYMIQDKMEVISAEDFAKKAPQKQKEYTHHKVLDGCMKCPLAAICLTDAKGQTSKSPMLKTIDELAQKVKAEGPDWALAQLMNLKPSVEGIIYREFEDKLHVKNWNEMWFKLTGKEFPGECTHDLFVKKCHEMKLSCYAGIDWGWSSPNTVVYFFIDRIDNVYVVKADGMTYISQPGWIHHIKTKYHNMYRCQMYFADPADQGAVDELKKAGMPVANNIDKSINPGIQVIKKLLRVPGGSEPKMFLAKETTVPLVQEFNLYHFKLNAAGEVTEDPDTEFDHWLDALRYALMMLLGGKTTLVMSGEALTYEAAPVDKSGAYTRAPNPAEFAQANNIRFNNEVDTSKIGKIVTQKSGTDPEDDEGDGGINGDGGFLWSF